MKITVWARWGKLSDWEWAWDCDTFQSAMCLKKVLRHRGYYGVALDTFADLGGAE